MSKTKRERKKDNGIRWRKIIAIGFLIILLSNNKLLAEEKKQLNTHNIYKTVRTRNF